MARRCKMPSARAHPGGAAIGIRDASSRTVTKLGVAATAVVALLVGAQLVPVARTNPAIEADVAAPAETDGLLRRACYDCHSRETAWPW